MRKANLIQTAIWDDAEFAAIGPDSQLLYLFLVTQPTVSTTGLLSLRRRYWAQRLFSGDQDRLEAALDHLDRGMFVWLDEETEELIIRSWVKHNVQKSPNMEKGARDSLLGISSVPLRIRLVDAYPTVFDALPDALNNPSETHREPFPEKARERVRRGKREEVNSSSVDRPRARNAEWDALTAIFGYSPTSKTEQRHWGNLCAELKRMKATADSIPEAARRYRSSMPSIEMTPPALVKHYERLMASNAPRSSGGIVGQTLQLAAQARRHEIGGQQ